MAKAKCSTFLDSIYMEIVLRIFLFIIFLYTEEMEPFKRMIQPEEWWLYKNPKTVSYVTTPMLYTTILLSPSLIILSIACFRRDMVELRCAFLACSLGIFWNGAITNSIKLMVGRPRPDFYNRCFPDGVATKDFVCNGDFDIIKEGMKSFPSGHSSFTFSSLGFLSLYIAGKLHTFEEKYRGRTWRLLLSFIPIFIAMLIAISRTMDYHHHWQDVLVGSLLGFVCSYVSYLQYYPNLDQPECDKPLVAKTPKLKLPRTLSDSNIAHGSGDWLPYTMHDQSNILHPVKEM